MSHFALLCRLNCEKCPIEVHVTPTGGVGTSGSHASACRLVTGSRWRAAPTCFCASDEQYRRVGGACTHTNAPSRACPGPAPKRSRRPVDALKAVASVYRGLRGPNRRSLRVARGLDRRDAARERPVGSIEQVWHRNTEVGVRIRTYVFTFAELCATIGPLGSHMR